jgi:hypothetical protein
VTTDQLAHSGAMHTYVPGDDRPLTDALVTELVEAVTECSTVRKRVEADGAA